MEPVRKKKLITAELTPATPLTPSDALSPRELAVLPSGLIQRKNRAPQRKVLEEEVYLDKLGTLIQRDYFPDIPKLKAQTEYLEALEKNDVAKIRMLQQRYSTRRTDRRTSPTARRSPETFETPVRREDPSTSKEGSQTGPEWRNPSVRADKPAKDDTSEETEEKTGDDSIAVDKLTVNKFLAKYNSEDNASFEEQVELDRQKSKQKIGWMYKAETEHNKRMVTYGDQSLRPADEQVAFPAKREVAVDNWRTKAHNALLYYPKEAPYTEEEEIERMKMNQQEIIKKNTRLPPDACMGRADSMSKAASIQAVVNRGKIDPQGNIETGAFRNPAERFSFVATPSPAPGVSASPMMTWGQIEGTPFMLDASDTLVPNKIDGPQFKIPEIPLRDKLAHEMMDTIGRRFREKKRTAQEKTAGYHTKTPRFGSVRSGSGLDKIGSMSPAARRLATAKLGIRLGSDKALKASYTPSPVRPSNRTPKGTPVPSPRRTPNARSTASGDIASSITDNLLQLPNTSSSKKTTASDYF